MSAKYQYIIVGAGTAGSLLASRLSKFGRVLLIEAGGSNIITPASLFPFSSAMTPWLHIPLGYLFTMNDKRTNWGFSTVIKEIFKDGKEGERRINYPRGKVLGGSGSINGMIYQLGNSGDYDSWDVECGRSGKWNAQTMREAVGRLEGWRKEEQRLKWDVLDGFKTAVEKVKGVGGRDEFVDSNVEGVGYFKVNQDKGRRVSSFQHFVDGDWWGINDKGNVRVFEGGNLEIRTNAMVKGLVFEDDLECGGDRKKVVGIDYWNTDNFGEVENDGDVRREILGSGGEVILSAGAIGSPKILQCSGVGSGRDDDRVELPGVGMNLHDHLQLRSVFKVKEGTRTLNRDRNGMTGSLGGIVGIGWDYLFGRRGPLSMAPSQLGCFLKSDPSLAYPDLQWHVQPLSLDSFASPLHDFPGITAAVCNLRPTSRGYVKCKGRDVRDGVEINNNYLQTSHDRSVAAIGLRMTRDIVTKGMKEYEPVEVLPGGEYVSDTELADAATRVGTSIFHPVGTCKMGSEDDKMSVVDDELRVIGVKNCRVVDASIMPSICSGNTNTPTMAIAERWVEIFINNLYNGKRRV